MNLYVIVKKHQKYPNSLNKIVLSIFALILITGVGTAYAQSDNDILQKWKDYVESYKGYMEEYKQWADDKFNDHEDEIKNYEDEIKELKSLNQNLTKVILDKDDEIIKVTDQQTRLGVIESGILNNIKISEMQDIIEDQEKKIIYLTNKTNAYEIEKNYFDQLDESSSFVEHDYQYENQCLYEYYLQQMADTRKANEIRNLQSEIRVLEFDLKQCREN